MSVATELWVAKISAFVAAAMLLGGVGLGRADDDVARGEALYENHCGTCHTCKAHMRREPSVKNLNELAREVSRWQTQQQLDWRNEDRNAVVEYLNRTFYKF
jgi:mono/diheme cytochrome c family protein